MALPNSNITTGMVRNELGESTNNVGGLCTSTKINMWSKKKPVRDSRIELPFADVGFDNRKYGINIPDYDETDTQLWTYKRVEGGWPFRLGDFRGYNHGAILPMQVQPQPEEVTRTFVVIALIPNSSDNNISVKDFYDMDFNLGVEVFDRFGALLGWASSDSIVEIDLSGMVANINKISLKFFLTDVKKDFTAGTVPHSRFSLPREKVGDNAFWTDVPVVDNPPAPDPYIRLFEVFQGFIGSIFVKIETVTYTGPVNIKFSTTNPTDIQNYSFNVPTAGVIQEKEFPLKLIAGKSYLAELTLGTNPIVRATTTFTTFAQNI